MNKFKKPKEKIKSILEVFNFDSFFYEYDLKQGFLIERNNEFIYNFNQIIKEKKEQKQYFLDTGNNFWMVIVCLEYIEVHKNGSYDHRLNVDAVKVNKDETIDLKYIKGLQENDYVEFYFDD